MPICKTCGTDKPRDEYYTVTGRDSLYGSCKKCVSLKNSLSQKKPDYQDGLLQRKYGITLRERQELVNAQGGKCAVCEVDATLVIDHDHETGKVRGMLCARCNTMMGQAKEMVPIFKRAIQYIERS
jgi:hypothetical protein